MRRASKSKANFLSPIAIAFFLGFILPLEARADYAEAKQSYEAMSDDDRATLSVELMALGDYNGFYDPNFTQRLYRAIMSFERRNGFSDDGVLQTWELNRLHRDGKEFLAKIGLRKYVHPFAGSTLYVPRTLFDREKNYEKGLSFETNDKSLSLSFSAHSASDKSLAALFDLLSTPSGERSVSYKRLKENFFVVTGEFKGRNFYTYMSAIPYGSTGFTLSWKHEVADLGGKLSILIANGFSAAPPDQSGPDNGRKQEPDDPSSQSPPEQKPGNSTGTGFKVTQAGHILTNYHVAGACKSLSLHRQGELPVKAALVAGDSTNDLALIKPETEIPGPAATFRTGSPPLSGMDIVLFGFPLSDILSSSGNTVTGNISSLAGLGNDSRYYQISAPIQPGNSGGPVMDHEGRVIGVVVSKLNELAMAKERGNLPQNVNFAIKGNVAMSFMDGVRLQYERQEQGAAASTTEIAAKAQQFTYLVFCGN